ncbi:hypothetical protein AVEN_166210-1 [Araneus ventricosus]|uniref:Uncharacterized protein n=1 Tax=Araneus ventricosus TaxID=182803 RepID=A0A4Y2UJG0_ARAVE|nr:hypothetical protein AVEN_166210-1 [Araneus ventricosus]
MDGRSVSINHCPMPILPVQLLSWHQARKNAAAFCQYNSLSMSILPVQLLSWHQASGKERRSVSITHCPMSILPVQLLSWHQTRGMREKRQYNPLYTSILPVQLLSWHQVRGHGRAFCQYKSLSHAHPTGSVAVWHRHGRCSERSVSITHCPCPSYRFSCCMDQASGKRAFCQYNSCPCHPTGSVAVMAPGIGRWRRRQYNSLYHVHPPVQLLSWRHRHGKGRRSVV